MDRVRGVGGKGLSAFPAFVLAAAARFRRAARGSGNPPQIPRFTGENHVAYHPGLPRYLMGNYAFYDPADASPRPYHNQPWRACRSQLTLFEAENPWGPWRLFYRDDNGLNGGYQPAFPTKWMTGDGASLILLAAGNGDDYRFVTREIACRVAR